MAGLHSKYQILRAEQEVEILRVVHCLQSSLEHSDPPGHDIKRYTWLRIIPDYILVQLTPSLKKAHYPL